MTTLKCYFDCVQYFQGKVEKAGYRFDFIDNVYTGNQFVVINGHRANVNKYYDGTPLSNMHNVYQALKKACNEAYASAVAFAAECERKYGRK